jgi:hypothetical protein
MAGETAAGAASISDEEEGSSSGADGFFITADFERDSSFMKK